MYDAVQRGVKAPLDSVPIVPIGEVMMLIVTRSVVVAMLVMLLFGRAADCYAAMDDEILKRLDAIDERLGKIEMVLEDYKAFKQLETLRNLFKGDEAAKKSLEVKKNKSDKYLVVIKWSTGDGGKDSIGQKIVEVYYTILNTSSKTISIVDGAVVFKDKLGEQIFRLSIERDINIAPGKEEALSGRYVNWSRSNIGRLLIIDKKHVDVSVDLDELMFKDGEVVRF